MQLFLGLISPFILLMSLGRSNIFVVSDLLLESSVDKKTTLLVNSCGDMSVTRDKLNRVNVLTSKKHTSIAQSFHLEVLM